MLTKEKLPGELAIERWEDRRDIKNLMGRYSYACLLKKDREIYDTFWSAREDTCLLFPKGSYAGADAVRGFYAALDRYNSLRAEWYRKLFPEQTKNLSEDELYGIGSYDGKHLTTPCIYVADDGLTAQAIYWLHGVSDTMTAAGPAGIWQIGLLFIDLVYENDAWKIWHLRCAYEVDGPHGQPFGTTPSLPGEEIPYLKEELAKVAEWFPKPNSPVRAHIPYAAGRKSAEFPAPPHPYSTWEASMSYGI